MPSLRPYTGTLNIASSTEPGKTMQLPNAESAIIPREKIVNYLLDITHEEGRGKAIFFLHFGFSIDAWEQFEQALLHHARNHEVAKSEVTPFGIRYVIEGVLQTPLKREPVVRVVWFIRRNETVPRLVTAYPVEEA